MLPATVLCCFPDLPLRFAPRGHRNGTNYSSLCHLLRANLGKFRESLGTAPVESLWSQPIGTHRDPCGFWFAMQSLNVIHTQTQTSGFISTNWNAPGHGHSCSWFLAAIWRSGRCMKPHSTEILLHWPKISENVPLEDFPPKNEQCRHEHSLLLRLFEEICVALSASRNLDGETRELSSFNAFLWSRPLWSQWLWLCFFVALHTQIPQGFSESAVAMNIAGISPWGLVVGWKIWWLVPCPWAAWQRTVFG